MVIFAVPKHCGPHQRRVAGAVGAVCLKSGLRADPTLGRVPSGGAFPSAPERVRSGLPWGRVPLGGVLSLGFEPPVEQLRQAESHDPWNRKPRTHMTFPAAAFGRVPSGRPSLRRRSASVLAFPWAGALGQEVGNPNRHWPGKPGRPKGVHHFFTSGTSPHCAEHGVGTGTSSFQPTRGRKEKCRSRVQIEHVEHVPSLAIAGWPPPFSRERQAVTGSTGVRGRSLGRRGASPAHQLN
jgi:hypothetical protein